MFEGMDPDAIRKIKIGGACGACALAAIIGLAALSPRGAGQAADAGGQSQQEQAADQDEGADEAGKPDESSDEAGSTDTDATSLPDGLKIDDETSGEGGQDAVDAEVGGLEALLGKDGLSTSDGATRIKSDATGADERTSYWKVGGSYYKVITVNGDSVAFPLTETVSGVNDAASAPQAQEDESGLPQAARTSLWSSMASWADSQNLGLDVDDGVQDNGEPQHSGGIWTVTATVPDASGNGVGVTCSWDEASSSWSFSLS